jgi:hypothetical protein
MKKVLGKNIMRLSGNTHKNKKLIFIHIPKTAGATFRSIMEKQYKRRLCFFLHDLYPEISLDYLQKISDTEFNKFEAIGGHGAQYVLDRAIDYRSIIFLRDPVNQILSSYYHIRRSPHNPLYKDVKKLKNISDYYLYLKDNDGFNYQTFYLSRSEKDFRQKKRFCQVNEKSFQKAIGLLEKIDYVFLTEHFDDALFILQKEFNFNSPYYLSRNLSKKRQPEERDPEFLQKIRHAQIWDYKLYKFAKKRYFDLRSKYPDEIETKVKKFAKRNKIYNKSIGRYMIIKNSLSRFMRSSAEKEKSWEVKPEYDSE